MGEQRTSYFNALALKSVASPTRVGCFLLQNFQGAMDACQVRVENGLPKGLIGRERIGEAHALGRREREIHALNCPAASRQQPAPALIEPGVKLRETLDINGAAVRETKLGAAREPRCSDLLFAAVIIFPGVVRRDGSDLK